MVITFVSDYPLDSCNVDDFSVDCNYGSEFEYTSCITWRFCLQGSIERIVLLVWSSFGAYWFLDCQFMQRQEGHIEDAALTRAAEDD